LTATALLFLSSPVMALEEEWTGHFFLTDKTYIAMAERNSIWNDTAKKVGSIPNNKQSVIDALASATRKKLGDRYVDDVLRLAKLESSYTCHIKGPQTAIGRAVGPLQVMPSSAEALGVSRKELLASCEAQIEAGLRHVEKCISVGASDFKSLAACHVAGWEGWNRRLAKRHEQYKQKYIRMAMAIPSQRRYVGG
jgi:hypothetical protein